MFGPFKASEGGYFRPCFCRGRSNCCGNHLVDQHPVPEGRPDRLALVDRLQEILGFDDDLVLIARAMSRSLTEGQVIGMRGTGQNLGETAVGLGAISDVKPERVLIFLIKADRALGSDDLVGIAHFAPGRDAAEIHLPHRARL